MAHEPALNLPNPWAAVGRDTEAGRALFALYNGFGHARNRGNDYSQMNRMKHLRYIAMHGVPEFPVPKPLPPEKPKVKVPHFPHKSYSSYDYHPVDFIPRRRRAAEILQQIRDDSYEVEMPPMPKGPLLDDAEKARLQEVFYWSNRNLGPEPPVAEPVRRLPKKGSIEEQELLLNEIAKEIEDREAFLNAMEEYGKGEQYRGQIMFEIQERVGQMKLLHTNITEQEKKESTKKSDQATPQASYVMPPPKSHARGQPRKPNANLRFDLDVTGASLPHFGQDPRFEKSSGPSYSTSRADETPAQIRASQHETSTASHSNPWTTTRTDTPEPAPANVIKTASCYGNAIPESQPPTPPPTTKSKILNLNPDFPSSPANNNTPNGSTGRSSSSINRRLANVKTQLAQNGGTSASSDRNNTSAMTSNSNLNFPSARNELGPCSPAMTPSSICSDPRSRSVRFQQNSAANPSINSYQSTPAWNEPPNARTSQASSSPNVKFEGDSDQFMRGVTANSNANFPSGSHPWDDQRSNYGSDAIRSPSSVASDPRRRSHLNGVRFDQETRGGSSVYNMSTGSVASNSHENYPCGSPPNWNNGCSPVDSPRGCSTFDIPDD
ncbi:hypothetical protein M758_6G176400 [Ceratodon purpureus]|nr:hypothetical protein M758_6G176400 [Ceratodon purpureus]